MPHQPHHEFLGLLLPISLGVIGYLILGDTKIIKTMFSLYIIAVYFFWGWAHHYSRYGRALDRDIMIDYGLYGALGMIIMAFTIFHS